MAVELEEFSAKSIVSGQQQEKRHTVCLAQGRGLLLSIMSFMNTSILMLNMHVPGIMARKHISTCMGLGRFLIFYASRLAFHSGRELGIH